MAEFLRGDRVVIVGTGARGIVQGSGDGATWGLPQRCCVLALEDGAADPLPHYPRELRRVPAVETAGLHHLTDDDYRNDPCPEPSLGPSEMVALLSQSPAHAVVIHPRLGSRPELQRLDFDLGRAAHAVLLGGDRTVLSIDAADYRTAAAKAARETAYATGRIPVLADRLADVLAMAAAARQQLGHHEAADVLEGGGLFRRRCLCWHENLGLWLRIRLDAVQLGDDRAVIYEYATTQGSAHAARWGGRTLWGLGPDGELGRDVVAALAVRGIRRLLDLREVIYRFIVQEAHPPFALNVVELTACQLADAAVQVERAVCAWAACVRSSDWPAYAGRVVAAERPAWVGPAVAQLARMSPLPDDPLLDEDAGALVLQEPRLRPYLSA